MAGPDAGVGADGQEREMRDPAAQLQGASLGDLSTSPTVEMADLATSSRGAPRGMPAARRNQSVAHRVGGTRDDADNVQRTEAALNVVLQSARSLQRMPHDEPPHPHLESYLVLPEGRAIGVTGVNDSVVERMRSRMRSMLGRHASFVSTVDGIGLSVSWF